MKRLSILVLLVVAALGGNYALGVQREAAVNKTPASCGCLDCQCPDCNGEVCTCEVCACGSCACVR